MVASRRRTAICSVFERAIRSRRRSGSSLMLFSSPCSPAAQLDLGLFLVGLGERHLAFLDRPVQQQPGRELHQPRGQPHAFGRIGEGGACVRASWIPAGPARRDRRRSPRPAPCRRETDRRSAANPPAARQRRRGPSPLPNAPTFELRPHALRYWKVNYCSCASPWRTHAACAASAAESSAHVPKFKT